MKKIIVLLLVVVVLSGCTSKAPMITAGALIKDDLIIYDKDFNVVESPFENEDGTAYTIGLPGENAWQTARGVKVGDKLKVIREKYQDCDFKCRSLEYSNQVKGISLDEFCDRYEEFKHDDCIDLIFSAEIYGDLEFGIKDGAVDAIHTYSAAGLELREKAVQEKMKELDEKYAAG